METRCDQATRDHTWFFSEKRETRGDETSYTRLPMAGSFERDQIWREEQCVRMELELGRMKMVRAREKRGKLSCRRASGAWPQLTCPQFPFCTNIKQSNKPIQNFWCSKIKNESTGLEFEKNKF
jgi:hypothetical protein